MFKRSTRAHRRARQLTLAAIVAVAIPAAIPAASQASACGVQYWGPIHYQNFVIPSGQLFHCISGKGYHVSWDGANFASVGNLCDSSVEFTYGYGRYVLRGNVHWGCSHVGQWKYRLNWKAPRGTACARLYIHNWRKFVTQQCHFIHN